MSKTRPCSLCRIRPRDIFVTSSDLCDVCHDYVCWENEHSDAGHDSEDPDAPRPHDCPICNNEPPPWTIKEPEMTKTTAAKTRQNPTTSHFSHADCAHPRTPKDRAACRKAMRADVSPVAAKGPRFVRLGKSNTVHAPGSCVTVRKYDGVALVRTDEDVTCKNCLKTLATVDA